MIGQIKGWAKVIGSFGLCFADDFKLIFLNRIETVFDFTLPPLPVLFRLRPIARLLVAARDAKSLELGGCNGIAADPVIVGQVDLVERFFVGISFFCRIRAAQPEGAGGDVAEFDIGDGPHPRPLSRSQVRGDKAHTWPGVAQAAQHISGGGPQHDANPALGSHRFDQHLNNSLPGLRVNPTRPGIQHGFSGQHHPLARLPWRVDQPPDDLAGDLVELLDDPDITHSQQDNLTPVIVIHVGVEGLADRLDLALAGQRNRRRRQVLLKGQVDKTIFARPSL